MCEALDIKPAQRRLSRDRQKVRIQEKYQMVIHANNSITLTPLTKAEREEQDYKRAEEARLIIDIGDAIRTSKKKRDRCDRQWKTIGASLTKEQFFVTI